MSNPTLERIEADISHLSLTEQLWLLERLAQHIRVRMFRMEPALESQLATMANDPDVQRELRLIEADFAGTEADGLDVEQ